MNQGKRRRIAKAKARFEAQVERMTRTGRPMSRSLQHSVATVTRAAEITDDKYIPNRKERRTK